MTSLFDPVQAGDLSLAHRLVMAPLTRNRATGQVPTALMAEYYAQRAHPATGASLIITEATPISPMAHGYLDTPGLHTDEQVQAWKAVTAAVHAQGGRVVVQLWHVGRISHTSLLPGGAAPVAPSALRAQAKTYTAAGFTDVSAPRALALEELPGIVADYVQAARRAIEAGFDGVEIHAANGYLLQQFMSDGSNQRTDAYGGPIDHRLRLTVEVVEAVTAAIGAGRTGIRLSPVTPANDIRDSDPEALYARLAERLAPLGLAYVHVVEGATGGPRDIAPFDYAALRARFGGTHWMVNNGYTAEMAQAAIAEGRADSVAVGKAFIANPDLTRRWREGAALNAMDPNRLYGGGAQGYTDYPTLP